MILAWKTDSTAGFTSHPGPRHKTNSNIYPMGQPVRSFTFTETALQSTGGNYTHFNPKTKVVLFLTQSIQISCHGIPWFAFWIAFTWLFNNPSLIQMQVNMLMGLLVDIVLIAIAKAYFRRKRPLANTDDALGQIGPDVFSFPSGHASRAVFAVYFFAHLYGAPLLFLPPMLAWVTAVCVSRILMNRHYIMDVVGGIVLGLIEGAFIGLIWVDEATAKSLMSFLSDEKLDGGDYHV